MAYDTKKILVITLLLANSIASAQLGGRFEVSAMMLQLSTLSCLDV